MLFNKQIISFRFFVFKENKHKTIFFYGIYGKALSHTFTCGNHHSSWIAFVHTAVLQHCGLRWFTLSRPLKCVNRLLLSEFSYNASFVWSGVIVHKDRPAIQWTIVKIGYNVCNATHWGYLVRHTSLSYNLTKSTPRQLHCCHGTLLYWSSSRREMQCFYAARFEWIRPSTGSNIHRLSSDQWTPFQLQRRWSLDQFHWARRWRNDSCGRLIGRLAHRHCSLSRLLAILTDKWSPNYRIGADAAKWSLLAHQAIRRFCRYQRGNQNP